MAMTSRCSRTFIHHFDSLSVMGWFSPSFVRPSNGFLPEQTTVECGYAFCCVWDYVPTLFLYEEFVTSHHTPVEGRENTEPVWSPSATRFSAPTSHYYHRRRQVSSGLGIFRLSAARKFDPTRNRTPASWMANERHTTTLTHVFNVPPDFSVL